MLEPGAQPRRDLGGGLDLLVAEVEHPEQDGLLRQLGENAEVEPRLRRLQRYLARRRAGELRQEGVAARLVAHEMAVAETDMNDCRPGDAGERPVDRRDAVARRLVGRGAHPGLVELYDVDPGRLQLPKLGVDRVGIVHRQLFLVLVELVLHLLRHGERAGQRDLGRARRVGDEERRVVDLDLALAADPPGDPRHRGGAAVGADHRAEPLGIDAVERQREIVRVAFAPHLAVADDVDADPLHLADREDRRVVLRFLQLRRRDAPDLVRMDPRHPVLFERGAVDQPIGLRIGADDGGRDQMGRIRHWLGASSCVAGRRASDSIQALFRHRRLPRSRRRLSQKARAQSTPGRRIETISETTPFKQKAVISTGLRVIRR